MKHFYRTRDRPSNPFKQPFQRKERKLEKHYQKSGRRFLTEEKHRCDGNAKLRKPTAEEVVAMCIEKELMVILKLFPKKLKPSDIFTGGSLQVTVIKQ